MIYEPAEDSFLLKKYVEKYVKKGMKILDIGTGSGIQAETAIKKGAKVLASDINQESVDFVNKKGIKTIQSNLFKDIKGKFDLIIFNPPYLPNDKREDEQSSISTTGGKKGYEIIEKFLKEVKKYLNENGKILLVFSSLTNKQKINLIIKENNFKFKILEIKRFDFEEIYIYLINKIINSFGK